MPVHRCTSQPASVEVRGQLTNTIWFRGTQFKTSGLVESPLSTEQTWQPVLVFWNEHNKDLLLLYLLFSLNQF